MGVIFMTSCHKRNRESGKAHGGQKVPVRIILLFCPVLQ